MHAREKWFLPWIWVPIHWKGWAFLAVALPLMFALILLAAPRLGPNMSFMDYGAVGLLVIAAFALNLFMFRKS